MGMSLFSSGSSKPDTKVITKIEYRELPNPNKWRWEINKTYLSDNGWLVVVIKYLDCKNYEGLKVLVYDDNYKFAALAASKAIDPHFDDKTYSPVARFVPTKEGIKMACKFAKSQLDKREGSL